MENKNINQENKAKKIDKTKLMIELLKEFSQTETNKVLDIIEKLEVKND